MPTRRPGRGEHAEPFAVRRAPPVKGIAVSAPSTRPPAPSAPPAPPRPRRTALRALVPSAYRSEGEPHAFLRVYKAKWLSRLDFKSESSIQSLLALSFMLLALGRDNEAEDIADQLIAHGDVRRGGQASAAAMTSALYLSAWLKSKRQLDVTRLLERAKTVGRAVASRDRAWLSADAAAELQDAVDRRRLDHLIEPFAGILRWLNDSAARTRAEAVLALALEATRALMIPA